MKNTLSQGLLQFLGASPTPFHAVAQMVQVLQSAGFTLLHEADAWQIRPGGRYLVTRNDSSLIAFVVGMQSPVESGIRMIGTHTDSPCLKIKPQPELVRQGYLQLGVEVYGGVLLAPWFDRDLSLAGRVHYRDSVGSMKSMLIDCKKPVATIPSLAIHLDREANSKRCINAQTDLPSVLMHVGSDKPDFRAMLLTQIRLQDADASAVLDYELSFYDTQPPAVIGWHDEFIASARLDNLLSCYIGLQALLAAGTDTSVMLVCNDHEEVGSLSCCGARGPFLRSVLQRWLGGGEEYARTLDRSIFISADNAHGIHPNFPDKHDGNHGPLLNGGPVIKVNANQGYASNSETQAFFRQLCTQVSVPVQMFVARTDLGCGSTIGPLTAAEVGIKTVDVGVPTFAMHSIRELAGVDDATSLLRVLAAFFGAPRAG